MNICVLTRIFPVKKALSFSARNKPVHMHRMKITKTVTSKDPKLKFLMKSEPNCEIFPHVQYHTWISIDVHFISWTKF